MSCSMLRRHMACHASVHELARVYSLLRVVAADAPGYGPVQRMLSRAALLGFSWDPDLCVWQRPDLLALCQLSGLFQFLGLLFGMLGGVRSLVILVLVLVFGVFGFWISGPLEALTLASPERRG